MLMLQKREEAKVLSNFKAQYVTKLRNKFNKWKVSAIIFSYLLTVPLYIKLIKKPEHKIVALFSQ